MECNLRSHAVLFKSQWGKLALCVWPVLTVQQQLTATVRCLGTSCSSEASALVSGNTKSVPAWFYCVEETHTNTHIYTKRPNLSQLQFYKVTAWWQKRNWTPYESCWVSIIIQPLIPRSSLGSGSGVAMGCYHQNFFWILNWLYNRLFDWQSSLTVMGYACARFVICCMRPLTRTRSSVRFQSWVECFLLNGQTWCRVMLPVHSFNLKPLRIWWRVDSFEEASSMETLSLSFCRNMFKLKFLNIHISISEHETSYITT